MRGTSEKDVLRGGSGEYVVRSGCLVCTVFQGEERRCRRDKWDVRSGEEKTTPQTYFSPMQT